jgi:peptidoglycan/xylan/chitin deacetylase (PgdA/CDA1 family)
MVAETTQATSAARHGRLVGCRTVRPSYRLSGSTHRRAVALAFADGPGPYTPAVLDILERRHVPGTFFVIGQLVYGQEGLLRRALAQGSVLGNHTFTHVNVSGGGYSQIRSTQAAILYATGYTPCVFRPPHGRVSPLLISQARSLGLNTVGVGVDPQDWSEPGSGAIYERVVLGARPGAIILLHDGGPREQTVAALPRIITTLRSRGYRFLTVPQLLGLPPRYEPVPKTPHRFVDSLGLLERALIWLATAL